MAPLFEKGEPIRVIGGKNKGYEGWLAKGKIHPNVENTYVLLLDQRGEVFATWAKKMNLGPIRDMPRTLFEAILAGCADMELKMNIVSFGFGECQLDDFTPAAKYMEEKFLEATDIMNQRGSKAKVRRIKFDPPGSTGQDVAARATVSAPAPSMARAPAAVAQSSASGKRLADGEPPRFPIGAMDAEDTTPFESNNMFGM